MVDAGVGDWKSYADKLLDLRNHQIPRAIAALITAERERLLGLPIMQDDKYLSGKMTNFKVDTRNDLRAELRAAIKEEGKP